MTIKSLREKIRNINLRPTEKQKHVGNYTKGHINLYGLRITIENPKGSVRSGKNRDGKVWKSTLPDHYGYIKSTVGNDGDHVDCYVGPNHKATKVYVVDQKHHRPDHKTHHTFDEHKCMMGYNSLYDALSAYRAAFNDNNDRVLAITSMSVNRFKKWLSDGKIKRQPVNYFKGTKS